MSMYNDASLALIPSAVGDGVVYNARPVEVLGAELVTNGDFATDNSWIKGSGWTISGGSANASNSTADLYQENVVESGKYYKVTYTISNYVSGSVRAELPSNAYDGTLRSANGTYTETLLSGGTIFLFDARTSFTGSIDNVSVKEVLTSAQDFDFSRASEATRVLSGGRIEKVRTNSLLQSNDFDTTWTTTRSSVTSGQADKDGGTNAWAFLADTSSTTSHYLTYNHGFTGVGTVSIYAKANGYSWFRIYTGGDYAYFDVTNGLTGASTVGISASISSVGGGWYRCSLAIADLSTATTLYINIAQGDGVTSLSGTPSGTTGLFIMNAQVEQGTVATEYIETTTTSVSVGSVNDMPRLDWSGGCPSLLLEPQRTNLVTQSEYFGASTWTERSLSVTDNYATSPDGSVNASRILASGSDAALYQSISVTNGTTYTMSVWLKVVSGTLDTTISYSSTGFPDGEGDGGKYKDITVTDTWQRFSLTSTADQTISTITTPIGGFSGFNSGDDVLMWGAQCEVGSYATSYIPSYGTATTRAVDACSKTGISSLIGQSQGVIYWEGERTNTVNFATALVIENGTSNRIYLLSGAAGFRVDITESGTSSSFFSGTQGVGDYKIAIAYNSSAVDVYINGVSVFNDSSVTIPACQNVYLTDWASYNQQIKTKQALLFTTRLSDTELEKLTTL